MGISREHLPRARSEKTQIAHGLPFQSFGPTVLRYVSLTVLTAHGWNQISLLRAWFVSRLTKYKQGAFGKLAAHHGITRRDFDWPSKKVENVNLANL